MRQKHRFLCAMRFQWVSIAVAALALLPGLSSCSSGPRNSNASQVKKNSLRVSAPVNFAFATKDAIREGDDLEIKIQVTVPDSSWTADEPEYKVEGNTIKITPWMSRPRGSSTTAIAALRSTAKVIKGLKAGKYKVVVVNEGGKDMEINVEVKAKSG